MVVWIIFFQDSLTLIDRNRTGEMPPGDTMFEEWGKPLAAGSTNSLAPSPGPIKTRCGKPGHQSRKKVVLNERDIYTVFPNPISAALL